MIPALVKAAHYRRLTFCSEGCVHEYRVRSDAGYLRAQVEKRDRGVCAACGLDCCLIYSLAHEAWHPPEPEATDWIPYGRQRPQAVWHPARDVIREWLVQLRAKLHGSYWQADHIVPVVEDGGLCGLDGIRTLCTWCHKRETKALARRRAENRKRLLCG